jgi:hypothetical protein
MNCPFYGCALWKPDPFPVMLLDSHGNQCALVTLSHSPCQMELMGQVPDWRTCTLVNRVKGRYDMTEEEIVKHCQNCSGTFAEHSEEAPHRCPTSKKETYWKPWTMAEYLQLFVALQDVAGKMSGGQLKIGNPYFSTLHDGSEG